jgi:RluA family pseudouridine synthase
MNQVPDIQILYCDSALLVVNKPSGLSTLPDGYDPSLPHVKSVLERQAGKLWVVHRLDKETSGVLLFAFSADAHRSLNTQFEQHQVLKLYHALVRGDPVWQERSINLPLQPNGDRRHRTVIDHDKGKSALTNLKVVERFGQFCLVAAVPQTGRTHQIRAHLSSEGLTIVGDKLYGDKKLAAITDLEAQFKQNMNEVEQFITGMGLHARSLEFTHPVSGQRLKFEAPYPTWWEVVLERLRKINYLDKDH